VDQRRGEEPPTEGIEDRAAMSEPESQVDRLSRAIEGDEAAGRGPGRREPADGPTPARGDSPRGEHRRERHSRVTGDIDTIQAHVAEEGGATRSRTDGRRTGATHPSPRGGRKTASGP